ncbi:hypothetical protein T484DRAFT_1801795 [Baffinella frigidus]|nr:hypothetical protein T484DRAFT_1801795 [Cryptophyta sp. CCMP2293]
MAQTRSSGEAASSSCIFNAGARRDVARAMWAGRMVVERSGAANAPWLAARKARGEGARKADAWESAASERMTVVDRILPVWVEGGIRVGKAREVLCEDVERRGAGPVADRGSTMGGVRAGAAIWALTAVLCISGCGAGFCVKPSSTLPYCNFISYKIYVVTPTVDLAYFLALDSKAELLADAMKTDVANDSKAELLADAMKTDVANDSKAELLADAMKTDVANDSKAELLADAMKANEDCDNSIQLGASFCKNYACALTLPRCNAADDRPLPGHVQGLHADMRA